MDAAAPLIPSTILHQRQIIISPPLPLLNLSLVFTLLLHVFHFWLFSLQSGRWADSRFLCEVCLYILSFMVVFLHIDAHTLTIFCSVLFSPSRQMTRYYPYFPPNIT